jgi:hypothetical protein
VKQPASLQPPSALRKTRGQPSVGADLTNSCVAFPTLLCDMYGLRRRLVVALHQFPGPSSRPRWCSVSTHWALRRLFPHAYEQTTNTEL